MRAFFLDGDAVAESDDFAVVQRAHDAGKTYWIDLGDRTPEAERFLMAILKVHPLVVEDVWANRQLPKIEAFGDYLYILLHGVQRGSKPTDIHPLEIDVLLGARWVVTHQDASRSVAAVIDELRRSPRLLQKGPAWIVHALLDQLADHTLPLLDGMDDELEKLEVDVLTKAGTRGDHGLMRRLLALKRAVQRLRRIGVHQRDILLRLARDQFDEIPADVVPFFRDVHDHFSRIAEFADGHRELAAAVMEAYLSVQSNRMNEVMKRLTLVSTVMLPLTFIVGFYGMNFEGMPELHWRFGYAFSIGLMIVSTLGIVTWFRAKHWL